MDADTPQIKDGRTFGINKWMKTSKRYEVSDFVGSPPTADEGFFHIRHSRPQHTRRPSKDDPSSELCLQVSSGEIVTTALTDKVQKNESLSASSTANFNLSASAISPAISPMPTSPSSSFKFSGEEEEQKVKVYSRLPSEVFLTQHLKFKKPDVSPEFLRSQSDPTTTPSVVCSPEISDCDKKCGAIANADKSKEFLQEDNTDTLLNVPLDASHRSNSESRLLKSISLDHKDLSVNQSYTSLPSTPFNTPLTTPLTTPQNSPKTQRKHNYFAPGAAKRSGLAMDGNSSASGVSGSRGGKGSVVNWFFTGNYHGSAEGQTSRKLDRVKETSDGMSGSSSAYPSKQMVEGAERLAEEAKTNAASSQKKYRPRPNKMRDLNFLSPTSM